MNEELLFKLKELGLQVPAEPKPLGAYQPFVISGNTAYLSGQISRDVQGQVIVGKVGKELTLEQGAKAAAQAALYGLSILMGIGLQRFSRILRLTGYVQTTPEFYDIPKVVNGASDLFLNLFGEQGKHARSAVGMTALPMNAAVEIEIVAELKS